jgi:hypothetical protein
MIPDFRLLISDSLRFGVVSVLGVLSVLSIHAEDTSDTPVPFPELKHFAPLWERSVFTTKDLPAPEVVGGPSFIDNLSLSGMYEIQGEVVAMIVDKSTSMIFSAKIGSENEVGIKIRKITGDITDSKTRIQLQKGEQVGWLSQSDGLSGAPSETVRPAGVPGQPPAAAGAENAQPMAPSAAVRPRLGPGAPAGLPTRQAPAQLLLPPPASQPVPPQQEVLPQLSQSPPPEMPTVNSPPAEDIPLPPP